MAEAIEKLRNIEAEECLIGSVLANPDCFEELKTFLKVEDFTIHKLRWIYQAFWDVDEKGNKIDQVTVGDELDRVGKLAEIGGVAYLTKMWQGIPNVFNFLSYARIIKDLADRRRMISDAENTVAVALDLDKPIPTTVLEKYSTWAELDGIVNIGWSWKPWLPNGLLTILAGESGIGKSALALRICASPLLGSPWPDGSDYQDELGAVLWCECESFQAGHLDRAKKWGYPEDKIYSPLSNALDDVSLDNANHRAAIEKWAKLAEVKSVIVDSLSASSHRKEQDTEIKAITEFLARLARDINKPVLLSHHLRKKSIIDGEEITLDRLRGSSAIVQAARVVWALDKPDINQKEMLRLSQVKNNLGRFPEAIGMSFSSTGQVEFGAPPLPPHQETQLDKAIDLLVALLTPQPQKVLYIQSEFSQAGISWRTANEGKKRLNLPSIKKGDGWYWSLPAKDAKK